MTEPATRRVPPAGSQPRYLERFRTPWWWYPVALLVGALLGAEFAFIVPLWLTWLPIVISLGLAVLVVWRLSSASVAVTATELIAGDRVLPLSEIAQAIDLSDTELRRVVGRHGDPLAFNYIRSWVGPGVQLVLTEADPSEAVDPDLAAPDESVVTAPDEPVDAAGSAGAPDEDGFDDTDPPLRRLREPYWLVSSRHPRELIAAIQAATAAAG